MPTTNILGGLTVDGVAQGVTTADMTLYVDTATGVDTNTGLVGFPLKTIQAAINKVPYFIYHNVTIWVAAGTYQENLRWAGQHMVNALTTKIEGQTWNAVVPATGVASGAFTSTPSNFNVTMIGAGWTVNDLRGKFVKITSGTHIGLYYPIANNTADTIELPLQVCTPIATATFEIVTPAAILTGGGSTYPFVFAVRPVSFSITTNYGAQLRCVSVQSTTRGIYCATGCSFTLHSCIDRVASYGALMSYAGVTECRYSHLSASTTSFFGIGAFNDGYTVVANTVVDGNASTSIGLSAGSHSGLSNISDVIIHRFNGGGNAMGVSIVQGGSLLRCLIKDCTYGMYYSGGSSNLTLTSVEINGCTTGINVENGSGGGYVSLDSVGGIASFIHNCTGNAIEAVGYGTAVRLISATVTGNAGFGIKLPAGNAVSHNNIQIGSTVTMNTNVLGDLTLDGTNAITLAELRAAPQKTLVDANRLNRLAAD